MSQQAPGRPPVGDMSGQNDKNGSRQESKPEIVLKPNAATSFTIALKTGLGLNSREHWSVRSKRVKRERQQIALAWLVFVGKKRVQLPAVVTLTRIKPVGKLLDDDNLRGSLKGVRDQVAKELGVDDGEVKRVTFRYEQASGPWGVRVEVAQGPQEHDGPVCGAAGQDQSSCPVPHETDEQ